jgi:Tetratricopeptide Repeats-Sensor
MPTHAFVVRPFGTREGIDFELVQRDLIDRAFDRLGIRGDTTQVITRAGNIREDMFQLLVTADLVVADISIHNANVFYELGIRHGLRERATYLLRCKPEQPEKPDKAIEVPFDLRTDRYLEYDRKDLAASVDALVAGLEATLAEVKVDSPVFKLLPTLPPVETRHLLVVPTDFREELRRAEDTKRLGDLALLAEEARFFPWAREGLRVAAEALFRLNEPSQARLTWELVRAYDPDDDEANGRLATIFQKLAIAAPKVEDKVDLLAQSDTALDRVLQHRDVRGPKRAELLALRASNAKTRWMDDWHSLREGRTEAALRSGWLERAAADYDAGFVEDRNHYYSGLNALAMLTIRVSLGRAVPDVWGNVSTADEPAKALDQLDEERKKLASAVDLSLQSQQRRLEFRGETDPWLEVSRADFLTLTSTKPAQVGARYEMALAGISPFNLASISRQLVLYQDLGVVATNAAAALAAVAQREAGAGPAARASASRPQACARLRRPPPGCAGPAQAAVPGECRAARPDHDPREGRAGAAARRRRRGHWSGRRGEWRGHPVPRGVRRAGDRHRAVSGRPARRVRARLRAGRGAGLGGAVQRPVRLAPLSRAR